MYHIKETDIVIIGAGAAGAFAAIHAHKENPRLSITLLDKSKFETSGAAGRGMDALNTVCLPPYSDSEALVKMLTRVTEGILDQNIAKKFGDLCPAMVKELEEIMDRKPGDLFPLDEKGNYRLYYLHPSDKPMLLPMHGEEMKRALAARVRALGCTVHDRTPAIKLVVRDGRVAGVLGFNIRTGDYWFYKTKAVIITAGAAGRLSQASHGYPSGCYEFPGNTGDGFRLAYEAGAELVNMEYVQGSSRIKDHEGPACGYVSGPRGAYQIDANGDRMVGAHPYASGDTRLAVWRAYAEGRGPTYLKISHLDGDMRQVIEKVQFGSERTTRRMFHHQRGLSYDDPFCIELAFFEDLGICGGHGCSGILTDVNAATNVPGLYAAGDVDGGLPHSYLGGAFVMGGVAGEEAAKYASGVFAAAIDGVKPLVRSFIDEFEAPLRRERGIPVHLVEQKARTRIMYYMRPPQSPGMLRTGAWWMERIRNEDIPQIKADDYHNLLKCHEVQSILLMGEIMSKASLFRDESRWGAHHWRLDMPAKKPEWDRAWAVVSCDNGAMKLSKRKVPAYIIDCPDSLPYQYPAMKFDLGELYQLDPECKNITRDQWMIDHINNEGMDTARRLMIQPEEGE